MQQLTLTKSADKKSTKNAVKEPQISVILENEANNDGLAEEITVFQVCPSCGHEMPPQINVCWYCGYVLNRRLVEIAEAVGLDY